MWLSVGGRACKQDGETQRRSRISAASNRDSNVTVWGWIKAHNWKRVILSSCSLFLSLSLCRTLNTCLSHPITHTHTDMPQLCYPRSERRWVPLPCHVIENADSPPTHTDTHTTPIKHTNTDMHTKHLSASYECGLGFILRTSLIPYGCSYWLRRPLVLLIQLSPDGFWFSLSCLKVTATCKKWVNKSKQR